MLLLVSQFRISVVLGPIWTFSTYTLYKHATERQHQQFKLTFNTPDVFGHESMEQTNVGRLIQRTVTY